MRIRQCVGFLIPLVVILLGGLAGWLVITGRHKPVEQSSGNSAASGNTELSSDASRPVMPEGGKSIQDKAADSVDRFLQDVVDAAAPKDLLRDTASLSPPRSEGEKPGFRPGLGRSSKPSKRSSKKRLRHFDTI